MKKLIMCAIAASAALAGSAFAVPYSATGAGTSTIGGAGTPDYATLKLACDAVTAAFGTGTGTGPGTRDATTWTFEIDGSTTEAANVFLACNIASGGKIIFKPGTGVTPTITFTSTTVGALFANWAIGAQSDAFPLSGTTGTNGIIIDGSNTVGGTTRDLTFTHPATASGNNASVIALISDTDNTIIKNCVITNQTTQNSSGTSAFATRADLISSVPYTADNWTIQNCTLDMPNGLGQGPGAIAINTVNNANPITFGSTGFTIKDSSISGRQRGIVFRYAYNFSITGNSMRIGLNSPAAANMENFAIFCSASPGALPASVNTIANNRIYVRNTSSVASPAGPTAIALDTYTTTLTTEVNIYNNEIIVANVGARNASIASLLTRGIWLGSAAITSRIYNNTIWIPKNPNEAGDPVSSTTAFGIGPQSGADYNMDIRGNIIEIDEANIPAISETILPVGAGSGFTSDYNTVYAPTGFAGRKNGTNYATLAAFAAAATVSDANSDSFNPLPFFTNTSVVSPTITDLTLLPSPPTVYADDTWGIAPTAFNTSTVTTDYSGQTRSASDPYRGFDEGNLPVAPTAVRDWMILDTE